MFGRIVISATAAGVLAASALIGAPFDFSLGQAPQPRLQNVAARNLELVCPGAAVRTGGAAGTKVGVFDRVGKVELNGAFNGSPTSSVVLSELGDSNFSTQLSAGQLRATTGEAASLAVSKQISQDEQGSTLLNASQLQLVSSPRMNGLSGAACQRPSSDFWLLGGDTSVGRETLLVLTNSSEISATVSLDIFTETGQIQASGLTGISVASGESTVVPIAGQVSGAKSLAIHVTSRGGGVVGYLQQKNVRGLTAAGVDLVGAAEDAAKSQVIPGVLVRGAKDSAAFMKMNDDYADLVPVLRVFVPGTRDATVTGQVLGVDKTTFGTVVHETIAAGTVKDIPLRGLEDGDYAAFVDSDVPVLASIRLSRSTKLHKPPTDFTWLPAVSGFTTERQMVTPRSGISKLSIANPSLKPVTATLLLNGKRRDLVIPAVSSIVVRPDAGSVIALAAESNVYATLICDIDFTVASIPMLEYRNVGGQVQVTVH